MFNSIKAIWASFRLDSSLKKLEKGVKKLPFDMLRSTDKSVRMRGLSMIIDFAATSPQESDRVSFALKLVKELRRMASEDPDSEVRDRAAALLNQISRKG